MSESVLDARTDAALPPVPGYADFAEFSRDTIEAGLSSNAAFGVALEALGQEVAHYARAIFESAGETTRGLLVARTLEDVVRLQTDFAERSFAGFVERNTKLFELGYALFGASVGAWDARAKS